MSDAKKDEKKDEKAAPQGKGKLLAIGGGDYASRLVRVSARRVTRRALAALLGPRPLVSRSLLSERPSQRRPEDGS